MSGHKKKKIDVLSGTASEIIGIDVPSVRPDRTVGPGPRYCDKPSVPVRGRESDMFLPVRSEEVFFVQDGL